MTRGNQRELAREKNLKKEQVSIAVFKMAKLKKTL
jgi:4F5 protein related disordered region